MQAHKVVKFRAISETPSSLKIFASLIIAKEILNLFSV